MALGDGVMQRRLPGAVGGVERALARLEQQVDHGRGADGGGAVDGVLAAAVAHAGRGRGVMVQQLARHVHVVLGRDEVEGRLWMGRGISLESVIFMRHDCFSYLTAVV